MPRRSLLHPATPTLLALLLLTACEATVQPPDEGTGKGGITTAVESHDPPATPGALAPQLTAAPDGGSWLSWLEPTDGGHRLRAAHFDGTAWSPPVTVTTGDRFFANWADTPSLAVGTGGTLLAAWPAMIGDGPYAYGLHLALSDDGGGSWRELGLLHDDASPTEHGFVSLLPAPDGGFDAVWLDGRTMVDGGPMTLRHRRVAPDGALGPESVLDPRVCECCQTSAARVGHSDDGSALLVTYRDRSPREIRDVHAVRRTAGGWSRPAPVHGDGWHIPGCPVNGPAVVARGERAAVAWFTAASATPRVLAALSTDGGARWTDPVEIDSDAPLGRVDAVLLDDGSAAVSWLGGDGGVRLRRVSQDGRAGESLRVAATSTARASGFPQLERSGETLYVAWVEVREAGAGEDAHRALRFATVPLPTLRLAS